MPVLCQHNDQLFETNAVIETKSDWLVAGGQWGSELAVDLSFSCSLVMTLV